MSGKRDFASVKERGEKVCKQQQLIICKHEWSILII
jgi:hypothetical protein